MKLKIRRSVTESHFIYKVFIWTSIKVQASGYIHNWNGQYSRLNWVTLYHLDKLLNTTPIQYFMLVARVRTYFHST